MPCLITTGYYGFHNTVLEGLPVSDLVGLRLCWPWLRVIVLSDFWALWVLCHLFAFFHFFRRKGRTQNSQRSHHHHSVPLCNVYEGQRLTPTLTSIAAGSLGTGRPGPSTSAFHRSRAGALGRSRFFLAQSIVTGASKCPGHMYFHENHEKPWLHTSICHAWNDPQSGLPLSLMTGPLVFLRLAERPGLPGKWCCDDL